MLLNALDKISYLIRKIVFELINKITTFALLFKKDDE